MALPLECGTDSQVTCTITVARDVTVAEFLKQGFSYICHVTCASVRTMCAAKETCRLRTILTTTTLSTVRNTRIAENIGRYRRDERVSGEADERCTKGSKVLRRSESGSYLLKCDLRWYLQKKILIYKNVSRKRSISYSSN